MTYAIILTREKTGTRLAARIEAALDAVLPPTVEATARADPSGTFSVSVSVGGINHRFTAGWLPRGGPADIVRFTAAYPEIQVAFAPSLSAAVRERLTQLGLGWVDEMGRASVVLSSGLLISREPRAIGNVESASSTWTRTTAEVAEALLIGTTATTEAVRTATGLSHGATVTALGRLEREGLVRRPGPSRGPRSGRQVVDRDLLLREFASAAARVAQKQPRLLLHRIWKDPIQALSPKWPRR